MLNNSGLGGALYLSGGKVTIAGTGAGQLVIDSDSAVEGGGIYLSTGTLSLSHIQLNNNTASVSGGAILNIGTVTIVSSCSTTTWPSAPMAAASTTRAS